MEPRPPGIQEECVPIQPFLSEAFVCAELTKDASAYRS
jgi:hypothetical protein